MLQKYPVIANKFTAIVFTVFSLFFISTNDAKASHISGLDINYVCVGQDSFLVTLNLFRDCVGIGAPTSVSMSFTSTCGGSVTQNFTLQNPPLGTEVSQLCAAQATNSSCNGGALPGMQQYIYSGIVVLTPPCNTWTMSWSTCCRNSAVDNLVNPGSQNSYIDATLNSGVDTCNSSPVFTAQPIPYVCQNQIVNYNFGVVEPDGDSLVYTLVAALGGAATPLAYATGFSPTVPIPGITLNPTNGQLTFTPTTIGNFVVAVQVCEYDPVTGILKGCVTRDIQFIVINCSNQQPVIDSPGIFNFQGTGVQTDSNSVEVCVGNWFSFDVSFSDADTLDSITLVTNVQAVLGPTATVTITNGNPAVVNIQWTAQAGSASFNVFTITGIDDACPIAGIVSSPFDITVLPSTYAGPDQTICQGTQWADIFAVGGTAFTWTVLSGSAIDTVPTSPTFNATCQNCQFPSFSPQITTTYIVTSNMPTTCTNVDTITIFVAPNFDLTLPNDTLICSIADFQLYANTSQPTFSYTYEWKPAATLDFDTIENPIANPTDPTVYKVTVTSAAGCVKTDQVFIDLSPPFPPNITILGDTVLCLGDTTQLLVDLGDLTPTSCGLATSACIGNTQIGTIGTGTSTNTGTSYPAPYGNWYWGAKHQILFTVAELQAMGMTSGGKITSLAFDIATIGATSTFNNFEIKMGCTGVTDLAGGWVSGLVTVLPAANYTVNTGWNVHQFATAYDWDGTSNLVVEVCFNNSSFLGNGNAQTRYTITPNISVRYYRADNSNVCSSTSLTGTSSNRPNVQLGYCTGVDPTAFTYQWTPNTFISNTTVDDPLIYPPNTGTYTVYVADTFGGCVDTIEHFIDVVTQFNAGFNFNDPLCVSAAPDTATVFVGGGVFSGAGIIDSNLGVFDPAIGLGTWPVTYTVSSTTGGCLSDSTINVQVIPLPDASFTPIEVCVDGLPDTLLPATPGGTFSGPGITDPVNGIFDPTGLGAGDYNIIYTLTVPCYTTDTNVVRVIEPYDFTFDNPILSLCQNDTIHLSGNYTLSNDPLQGSGPIVTTWGNVDGGITDTVNGVFDATGMAPGDYIVTLTVAGVDGECGSVHAMTVRVLEINYPQFLSSLLACEDEAAHTVETNPALFASGTVFSTTPLTGTDTLTINAFGAQGRFDPSLLGQGSWLLTVEYTNANGCTGVSTDTIRVFFTPPAPTLQDLTFCEGDSVFLQAAAQNPDSLYWYHDFPLTDLIGTGNSAYWGIAPNPDAGPFTVYVTQNNWVCISEKVAYELPIMPSPEAYFEMTYTDTNGTPFTDVPWFNSPIGVFAASPVIFGTGPLDTKDSVFWAFELPQNPDTFEIRQGPHVVEHAYPSSGLYTPVMYVKNEFGCSDTVSALIEVISIIEYYNVFSPNGDGINDKFGPTLIGLENRKLLIYDRWGKKVFEYEYANGAPSDPVWDGGNNPDGVYFWIVTYTDPATNEEGKQNGTVTIVGSNK